MKLKENHIIILIISFISTIYCKKIKLTFTKDKLYLSCVLNPDFIAKASLGFIQLTRQKPAFTKINSV